MVIAVQVCVRTRWCEGQVKSDMHVRIASRRLIAKAKP